MRPIQKAIRVTLATSGALILSACGGGGGGGGGSGFVSTPSPPPPPPPPQYDFVKIFPNITQSTTFAAIGYENPGFNESSSKLVKDGFAVRYDAGASAYVIDLPSASGQFGASSQDASYWHGVLINSADDEPSIDILKPNNPDLGFVYTTFGDYYEYEFGGPVFDGQFAFGTPTSAGSVPVTGAATYSALLSGRTLGSGYEIWGTATLNFNFALGTLAGSISPEIAHPNGLASVNLGPYNFVNTIYSVGSPTFSGGLQHSTSNLTGSFNGLFTGPAAQELMARWTAQYSDPAGTGTKEMYGVLVGKKP